MKKLVVMVLSLMIGCVSIGSAQAAEVSVAKLHMKITSKINDKVYALCLSDTCYPLVAKGKLVPMEASKISSVIMTDMRDMTVNKNQTLMVSGQLVSKGESVYLDNMHCTVN
jgi:hypothetical protein